VGLGIWPPTLYKGEGVPNRSTPEKTLEGGTREQDDRLSAWGKIHHEGNHEQRLPALPYKRVESTAKRDLPIDDYLS
jgi:hypothetical protein